MTTPYDLLLPRILALLGVSTEDLEDDLDDIKGTGFDTTTDSLEEIGGYIDHSTGIFPADTARTCTLEGGAQNVYGAWTRLVDNLGTFFDASITEHAHITSVNVEFEEVANAIWMMELGYGAARTVVARVRWVNTIVGIFASVQQYRIRSPIIPTGVQVFGRLMCSDAVAGRDMRFHIRYYMHG